MMNKYTALEKGILERLADLSLRHGPVVVQITTERAGEGFAPEFIIKSAPDGVLRDLLNNDDIASVEAGYGGIRILPAPRQLQGVMTHETIEG